MFTFVPMSHRVDYLQPPFMYSMITGAFCGDTSKKCMMGSGLQRTRLGCPGGDGFNMVVVVGVSIAAMFDTSTEHPSMLALG